MTVAFDWTPTVLRNRGCQIRVLADPQPDDGSVAYELVWCRVTWASLERIERDFGGVDWDTIGRAVTANAFGRLTDLLVATTELTRDELVRRLDPALIEEYVAGVGVAFQMANGVDPTDALTVWGRTRTPNASGSERSSVNGSQHDDAQPGSENPTTPVTSLPPPARG